MVVSTPGAKSPGAANHIRRRPAPAAAPIDAAARAGEQRGRATGGLMNVKVDRCAWDAASGNWRDVRRRNSHPMPRREGTEILGSLQYKCRPPDRQTLPRRPKPELRPIFPPKLASRRSVSSRTVRRYDPQNRHPKNKPAPWTAGASWQSTGPVGFVCLNRRRNAIRGLFVRLFGVVSTRPSRRQPDVSSLRPFPLCRSTPRPLRRDGRDASPATRRGDLRHRPRGGRPSGPAPGPPGPPGPRKPRGGPRHPLAEMAHQLLEFVDAQLIVLVGVEFLEQSAGTGGGPSAGSRRTGPSGPRGPRPGPPGPPGPRPSGPRPSPRRPSGGPPGPRSPGPRPSRPSGRVLHDHDPRAGRDRRARRTARDGTSRAFSRSSSLSLPSLSASKSLKHPLAHLLRDQDGLRAFAARGFVAGFVRLVVRLGDAAARQHGRRPWPHPLLVQASSVHLAWE